MVPSETNFLFAAPANGDGGGLFKALRDRAIIVRYFPGAETGKYIRISIGTDEQTGELLAVIRDWLAGATN